LVHTYLFRSAFPSSLWRTSRLLRHNARGRCSRAPHTPQSALDTLLPSSPRSSGSDRQRRCHGPSTTPDTHLQTDDFLMRKCLWSLISLCQLKLLNEQSLVVKVSPAFYFRLPPLPTTATILNGQSFRLPKSRNDDASSPKEGRLAKGEEMRCEAKTKMPAYSQQKHLLIIALPVRERDPDFKLRPLL